MLCAISSRFSMPLADNADCRARETVCCRIWDLSSNGRESQDDADGACDGDIADS